MEPDDLLCSRNARPPKALVGRAQWKINQPPSLKRSRASLERGWERPRALFSRRAPTMKRIGRTPTLVLCSRNARPEKGLVRRPHVDQHGCPSKKEKASELGGTILYFKTFNLETRTSESSRPVQATEFSSPTAPAYTPAFLRPDRCR
jgi:hypothetical protein